jgi:thiamine biosynthesis lipoprotein
MPNAPQGAFCFGSHLTLLWYPRQWRSVLVGALLALVPACSRGPVPVQLDGPTMGTSYSVTITRLPRGVQRSEVEAAIDSVLSDADLHLSGWNDASELVRVNASQTTEWLPISPILLAAVKQAHAVSVASGGAFDITVGPLVRAWGFGAGVGDEPTAPSSEAIQRLLTDVGYTQLALRTTPPGLRKSVPGLALDLDGIAPGWAVDRIAERLAALGITDYLVELGGEVTARGESPEGRCWRVAVEKPVAGQRSAQAVIELDGLGVSTSGDYRDYREIDGRRISHTIDPRTGMPVMHGLASVTVVHASVADADAWATALMVAGPEQGMAIARRHGLPVLFIRRGSEPGVYVESETPEFARLRLRQPARL